MKQGLNDVCYGFFSTLANPTRLALLEKLRDGPQNVSRLALMLDQEQSMISHNLKLLEKCHLIKSERRGKQKYVSLNGDTFDALLEVVENHAQRYCDGNCS